MLRSAPETELRERYHAITAAQTVRVQGRQVALRALWPGLESPDRRIRERSWRLEASGRLADRSLLDHVWHGMVRARRETSAPAGTAPHPDECGASKHAVDLRRHTQLAVEEFVTSVLVRLHERRRLRLGLRTIRPWDLLALPPNWPNDPLFPTQADLSRAVRTELDDLNCATAEWVPATDPAEALLSDAEVEDALSDCAARWATSARNHPETNVDSSRIMLAAALKLLMLQGPRDRGGSGSLSDTQARAGIRHLERCLLNWTYGAMRDAFEDSAYGDATPVYEQAAADVAWSNLWLRFLPAVDWAGLDDTLAGEWQRHSSLFLAPRQFVPTLAAELDVFHRWIDSADLREWVRDLDVPNTISAGDSGRCCEVQDDQLLDVARWIEDSIQELETAFGRGSVGS